MVVIMMCKIDVSQWKEFKVGNFFKIRIPKKVPEKNSIQSKPDKEHQFPLINAQTVNNGIAGYVKDNGSIIDKIPALSIGSRGSMQAFVQEEPFVLGNSCIGLIPKINMSKQTLLFLATMLFYENYYGKNGYQEYPTKTKLENKNTIKLPVDSIGNPDWQYMDTYIAKRAALAHKFVSELKSTRTERKSLKISGWREYKIGQLFNIRSSKYIRGNGPAFSNRKLLDDGPNPVVVNSSVNNGIGGTTSYEPTEHGNVITYSDTVDGNTIFYQAKPFVGYSHVKVMEPKEKLDPAEMVFLTAVIGRRLSDGNYDYTNKMTTNRVLNTTIKLPALSDGTPDWATMRKRVAHLAALSHRNVTSLDPAELPVFVGDWQEFKIGQLFDIETGGDLVFRDLFEGKIPVVSHSMENNGVKGYYQEIKGRKRYDHEITLALADRGTFFVSSQAKDFYIATRVKALIFRDREHINENIQLFLCSVINRLALRFVDYSENATNRLPSSVIKLPVDSIGHPDWQYMDNYVAFMKLIADRHVGSFQSIINNL